MFKIFFSTLLLLAVSISAMADSLYGTIKFKKRAKEKDITIINTSWDYAKTADLDKNGNYKIDFGEKVDKKITVYVNGNKYKEVEIKGDTKLDIVIE